MSSMRAVYVVDAVRGINTKITLLDSGSITEFYELPGLRGAARGRLTLIKFTPIVDAVRSAPVEGLVDMQVVAKVSTGSMAVASLAEEGVVASRHDTLLGVPVGGFFLPTMSIVDDHSLDHAVGVMTFPQKDGRHIIGLTFTLTATRSGATVAYDTPLGYNVAIRCDPLP